jgi:hypothetical protein
VLGRTVASELHAVPGHAGWMLECQYTPERRDEVRAACRKAVGSVARR